MEKQLVNADSPTHDMNIRTIRYHIKGILHELHLMHEDDDAELLNPFVKKVLKTEIFTP